MQRRTALVSAGTIAVVVLTGAAAVGANIGILSTAGDTSLGQLSAVTDVDSTAPPSSPSQAVNPDASTDSTTVRSQDFVVDAAGSVQVEITNDTLRLGSVSPADGWTWSSGQSSDSELVVVFDHGDLSLEFIATLASDGTVSARVAGPTVTQPAGAAGSSITTPTTSPTVTYDDQYDDHGESYDHDDSGDHDESDDHDDHHEYEGGDDDD